jgi:hypothetical protein
MEWVDAESEEECAEPAKREADDVGKAALDPFNEGFGSSLDCVAAGLIKRLTRLHIVVNLGVRQGSHSHLGHLVSNLRSGVASLHKGEPGYHQVTASAQQAQKPVGLVSIFRLTQEATATFDDGVCAKDQPLPYPSRYIGSFAKSQGFGVECRRRPRKRTCFIDQTRDNLVLDPQRS